MDADKFKKAVNYNPLSAVPWLFAITSCKRMLTKKRVEGFAISTKPKDPTWTRNPYLVWKTSSGLTLRTAEWPGTST